MGNIIGSGETRGNGGYTVDQLISLIVEDFKLQRSPREEIGSVGRIDLRGKPDDRTNSVYEYLSEHRTELGIHSLERMQWGIVAIFPNGCRTYGIDLSYFSEYPPEKR